MKNENLNLENIKLSELLSLLKRAYKKYNFEFERTSNNSGILWRVEKINDFYTYNKEILEIKENRIKNMEPLLRDERAAAYITSFLTLNETNIDLEE